VAAAFSSINNYYDILSEALFLVLIVSFSKGFLKISNLPIENEAEFISPPPHN
jgi:hypothetical protein